MQNKKVFVAFLYLKNGRQGVVVKTTTSMNSEAWGFIYDKVILVVVNDLNIQVKNGRLLSDSRMNEFITIFNGVLSGYFFTIDGNPSLLNGRFVIFEVISLELLD
jgi:hypothetical protein